MEKKSCCMHVYSFSPSSTPGMENLDINTYSPRRNPLEHKKPPTKIKVKLQLFCSKPTFATVTRTVPKVVSL